MNHDDAQIATEVEQIDSRLAFLGDRLDFIARESSNLSARHKAITAEIERLEAEKETNRTQSKRLNSKARYALVETNELKARRRELAGPSREDLEQMDRSLTAQVGRTHELVAKIESSRGKPSRPDFTTRQRIEKLKQQPGGFDDE